jgi:capsular polysaccharide transport system permease protein
MALAASRPLRTPFQVTWGTWKALFLRECVSRLSRERLAVVWLIVEPLAHLAILMAIRVVVRQRNFAGADPLLFYSLGVMAFFLPRNMILRSFDAVGQSSQLYAHRQIKPIDAVLARAAVEGVLAAVLFILVLAGLALLGVHVTPKDPLGVLMALGVLWMAGLGMGLVNSVIGELLPILARILRVLLGPLYILSGVMFPAALLPHPWRDYLLYNPLLHGLESLRTAYIAGYHAPAEVNLGYPFGFAVLAIFFGLALHLRFQGALIAK